MKPDRAKTIALPKNPLSKVFLGKSLANLPLIADWLHMGFVLLSLVIFLAIFCLSLSKVEVPYISSKSSVNPLARSVNGAVSTILAPISSQKAIDWQVRH